MEVVARHVQAFDIWRQAEADHRAGDVLQMEFRLGPGYFRQRPVGFVLGRNRAGVHGGEIAGDQHCGKDVLVGDGLVNQPADVGIGVRAGQGDVPFRLEAGDGRERRGQLVWRCDGPAIGADLVDDALVEYHFAVQAIERADAEIAVSLQFARVMSPS